MENTDTAQAVKPLVFIGTKEVAVLPMNRQQYNEYRGWTLPENENGADEGYLVEYLDGGQANDSRHAGYISWSPKEVFERAYRCADGPDQNLTFGDAIFYLKKGYKLSRQGWNGLGMWIAMSGNPQNVRHVPAAAFWSVHNAEFAHANGGSAVVLPCITMKTMRDEIVMGWTPSQEDMLFDDWCLVA